MQLTMGIAGVTAHHDDHICIMTSHLPLTTLASSIIGGGFGQTRHLLNASVEKSYQSSDPVSDLAWVAAAHGIRSPFVRNVYGGADT